MAQEAHQAPVGRSRTRSGSSSATSLATAGMWESPPQTMQAHTPFPSSWIPSYAGTFAAGAAAAAPSSPSEHGPDRAWNQSAPPEIDRSVGAHGGSGSGYRGNFLSLLQAKNVTPEMFADDVPAACDYLGGVGVGAGAAGSSMAAGPASACGGLLLGSVDPYSAVASSAPPVKHETASLPSPLLYSGDTDSVVHGSSMGCMPCYDHEEKPADDRSQRQGFGAPSTAAFLQQMLPSRVELQSALLGYSGMVSVSERLESSIGVGSLDAGSFSYYNRSSADFTSGNSNSNSSRQEQDIRPAVSFDFLIRDGGSSSASGAATSAATRRKSEEGVRGNTTKSKQEASPKPQVPKVKLGEKITALQQIVSPFGKTDTSSVLFETIEYIKFLHEQIRSPDTDRLIRRKRLFSEPYMTKSTYKGHTRRRGEEKEEERGTGHDLRGSGLCLVPVSLTSQAYHDDTLPDCWAPAYRSCMYP